MKQVPFGHFWRQQKKKIFFFIALALAVFTAFILYPRCDRLMCISAAGIREWREQEVFEHTPSRYRALLKNGNDRVRVEKNANLSQTDAAYLINVNLMQLSGTFDDARSPYPGAISDRIHCDATYKPVVEKIQNGSLGITFYTVFLNNRLQYGSCLDTELPYESYSAYFYCPAERALYHLDFIYDKKEKTNRDYISVIRSISCKKIFPL